MFLLERESVILSTVMETSEVFVIPHRTWRGGREPCVTWLGYVVQVKFELRLWREKEWDGRKVKGRHVIEMGIYTREESR